MTRWGAHRGGAAKEWFTAAEIAAAKSPELPGTDRGINKLADAQGWRADPARARRTGGRGGQWEYHLSLLPVSAQARLVLMHAPPVAKAPEQDEASKALWERYEALPKTQKDECARRLAALILVNEFVSAGCTVTAAVVLTAAEINASSATIFNWRKLVAGQSRSDWLAALAPGYRATAQFAECHPEAWEFITSDWLRPEKPAFSACYRRMRKVASANSWMPIPSERALRRRLEAEVPRAVAILARDGRDKAKELLPNQRIRAACQAGDAE